MTCPQLATEESATALPPSQNKAQAGETADLSVDALRLRLGVDRELAHARRHDVVVLVERPVEPRYRLSQRGFRAIRGIDAAVDVVVWDRATFDARLHLLASLPPRWSEKGLCCMAHDPERWPNAAHEGATAT